MYVECRRDSYTYMPGQKSFIENKYLDFYSDKYSNVNKELKNKAMLSLKQYCMH